MNLTTAANISLLALASLTTLFTLIYAFRSPWWMNRIGTLYLVKSITLSIVLIQITVAIWGSPDFMFRQQIRFAIYTLGAIAYVAMIISLVREQQAMRKRKKKACEEYKRTHPPVKTVEH